MKNLNGFCVEMMGAAGLIEGDFPKGCFEGEGLAPVDVLIDEALHLLPGLLSKLHVQGNVGGSRLKDGLTRAHRFPQQRRGAEIRSVLKAAICIWKIGKMEDLPPPEGPATITMRGAGMQAGLLLHAQLGVHIGEARPINDAALFVDEPSAESQHPLFADLRSAMSNQSLVEGLTFGGIVDVDPVHVEGILQSGHTFSVRLAIHAAKPPSQVDSAFLVPAGGEYRDSLHCATTRYLL